MKVFYPILFLVCFCARGQVGIGTTTPSPAAMLEVSSEASDGSFRGFMPPRISTPAALNDIASRATVADIGLLVFYNEAGVERCLKMWDGVQFKNVYCLSTSSESSVVSFTSARQTITENAGAIDLAFSIENPSPFNSLQVTISASDYTHLEQDAPVTISISRGYDSFTSSTAFAYKDNSDIQGNSDVLFTITAVTGGDGTSQIGTQNIHTLGIIDDDLKLWINEFRYENTGSDITADEFVEVGGNALDVSGYQIVHYNGSNGAIIKTVVLSGVIPNQQAGYGTMKVPLNMQNGPDGIALVDPLGNVMQFLSYEGSFTATTGPAAGMTAVDIGVSMPTTVPVGYSLKLIGTGNSYTDFDWDGPDTETPGAINSGQTFN